MNDTTPTPTAVRQSIAHDVEVAMEDLNLGLQKAAEIVVSNSDFVAEEDESQIIEDVVEEIQS